MNRRLESSLVGTLMLVLVTAAGGAEFYVDAGNETGTESGTQDSPFRTVQAAIDAAGDGDIIRVAAGTYVENLRIQGKALVLEGGYSGDWERDTAANTTTLSGDGEDAVINLIESDSTIDGFRITGGGGSTEEVPYGYHGGGIYSRDGSPTLSNNLIEDNDIRRGVPPEQNYHFGGGVHVTKAATATITATIVDNVVRGNFAGRGAGISVVNVDFAEIRGNTIEDNVSIGDHGGGLYIGVADARITQNIIRRNEVGRELSYGWGGGLIVFNAGNFAELSFNQVYENYAAGYGAGEFIDEGATADIHHELIYRNVSKDGCETVSAISVDGGALPDGQPIGSVATISFCTVVGNACENSVRGNGLQVEGLSEVTVTNSIFWDNSGDDFAVDGTSSLNVTFTDSQEGFAGTGNISADPRFLDAAAGDFRLAPGSPCIDAGDPDSPFDQEPAPNGGRADMGRFGNAMEAPPPEDPDDNDNMSANENDNISENENDNVGDNVNDNTGGGGGGSGGGRGGCGAIGMLSLSSMGFGLMLMRRRSSLD